MPASLLSGVFCSGSQSPNALGPGVLPVHQTIAPPTDVHAKASRFAPLVSGLDFSAHWVGGQVAGPGHQPAAWQRGWASGKAWAASWPRASGRRGKGE